ncbi:hypothetical protein K7432_014543 [Basidiobolus ranarum]|uniref:Uncharacterized protein n=1 Tax=Basidiobolus ranarum TaxID=34480 RepID=A0ABR2WHE3_9FUNG
MTWIVLKVPNGGKRGRNWQLLRTYGGPMYLFKVPNGVSKGWVSTHQANRNISNTSNHSAIRPKYPGSGEFYHEKHRNGNIMVSGSTSSAHDALPSGDGAKICPD